MVKLIRFWPVSLLLSLCSALVVGLTRSVLLQRLRSRGGIALLLLSFVLVPSLLTLLGYGPFQPSQRAYSLSANSYGRLGQSMWNGASSWLFGTNDTQEYDNDSILTDPNNIILPSLASAHIGLVRSFFFHYTIYGDTNDHRTTIGTTPQDTRNFSLAQYASPAPNGSQLPGNFYEIERRIDVIQRVGATCLGVLPDITTDPAHPSDGNAKHNYRDPVTGQLETDLEFDEEVVAYLGNRCNLYEFGNEPDNSGMSEATYVQKWNEFIPYLKALNPNAIFIGGVLADDQGLSPCSYPPDQLEQCFMTEMLEDIQAGKMKPVPDAISFHWYPCDNVNASTASKCLTKGNPYGAYSYADAISQVRAWMQQILGHTLPLGITEWNADPGSNSYMDDTSFMTQYTADALQSMIDAKLDFAAEFDAQSGSGYTYLDMFDLNNHDRPKAQYTEMAKMISEYYGGQVPPPVPTPIPATAGLVNTAGPGSPVVAPGKGTPTTSSTAAPGPGTVVLTPSRISILYGGDTTATPGQGNGGNQPGQRPVLLIPISPNNVLLDILFIVVALAVGIGIAFLALLLRKRRRKKEARMKALRSKSTRRKTA